MNLSSLEKTVKIYKDFPKKGVIFRDISPIIASPEAFKFSIDKLAEQVKKLKFGKILAIDARGFIFASALAYKLKKGLIMCRKPSKLPGKLITENFGYEYDSASLSVQKNSIKKGEKVLIVDDVLATGNTALAAYKALYKLGAKVSGIAFFLELGYLSGREFLAKTVPVETKISSALVLEK